MGKVDFAGYKPLLQGAVVQEDWGKDESWVRASVSSRAAVDGESGDPH